MDADTIDENPLIPEEDLDRYSVAGRRIYDERLKAILEPDFLGQIVAIHLDSADHEVAPKSSPAHAGLRQRQPTGMIMITDVGPSRLDADGAANRYIVLRDPVPTNQS